MKDKNQQDEKSQSGVPVFRHQEQKDEEGKTSKNLTHTTQIEKHIEKYVGKTGNVFHEIISDRIHIDIHISEPTRDRNFYTLVTSGMSERPMTVPEGAESYRYGELFICLPPEWKLTQDDFKDDANYWPLRLLKMLARLPHQYGTWLSYYHTIPNEDPPKSYAHNTKLSGAMLISPLTLPDDFSTLQIDDDITINFYGVLPLYKEEMNLKLTSGTNELIERLIKIDVSDILTLNRKNAGK